MFYVDHAVYINIYIIFSSYAMHAHLTVVNIE